MINGKPFEELDLLDDFMINAVVADPDVGEAFCRKLLSVLLQRSIGKLNIVAQRIIPAPTPGLRGIRMDVEITEYSDTTETVHNIYDLEPHLQKDMNFPRHNRFYQAKIDSRYMHSRDNDFSHMPNLYVITITNFDPFGQDYMMYTVNNQFNEVDELEYDDGLKFIYFYTGGRKGGNEDIKILLKYLQNSTIENATNETTKEIHEYTSRVKLIPEVRKEYMKFEELMTYARLEGRDDGRTDAIIELLSLHGEVSTALYTQIKSERNSATLRRWLLLAAKVESIEEFANQMI